MQRSAHDMHVCWQSGASCAVCLQSNVAAPVCSVHWTLFGCVHPLGRVHAWQQHPAGGAAYGPLLACMCSWCCMTAGPLCLVGGSSALPSQLQCMRPWWCLCTAKGGNNKKHA